MRDAARRLALALVLSVAAHLLLAGSLTLETLLRNAGPVPGKVLSVRIEPLAEPAPVAPAAPAQDLPATKRENVRTKKAEARLALPQAPAPEYYSTLDLDFYPRPAAPLEFGVSARGTAATSFRFQLLIDESGAVNSISAVEGEPPQLGEALRATLAAVRFLPGRKNGRAVKSRVTLSVDLDPARP
jgi:hypothetical protein